MKMIGWCPSFRATVADTIIDDPFLDQALNHRDIQESRRRVATAADAANRFGREVEECREALDPLIEELAPMDEHERTDAALGDQPRAHDRFAECGGGRQHAGVVCENRVRRDLLLAPQFPLERHVQRSPAVPFVTDRRANPKVSECVSQLVEAAPRKTDVMGEVLGAGDDARLVVGRQPH
jgi:hypothetical protein